jgi:hypothetical protein
MRNCLYIVMFNFIDTSLWDVPVLEDADVTHVITWVAKTVYNYHVRIA